MSFADAHAHLTWKSFDPDREAVLERARTAGVSLVVDCGIDRHTNEATLALSTAHPGVYSTLGFSPSHVPRHSDDELGAELAFIEAHLDRAVALGEVGLDYHWVTEAAGRRRQEEFFARCCTLARERDAPLVVHSRKSEARCLDLVSGAGLADVVFHCFSGTEDDLRRATGSGYYVSLPTSVCHSRSHQRHAAQVPDGLLLLETDSPFLAPRRGERNEPAFVVEAFRTVAGLRGCAIDELGELVLGNARRVFRLKG